MTPGAWPLPLARCLAWALLMGGWWQLGRWGRQHTPLLAGGLVPLALWLLATGLALATLAGRRIGTAAVRGTLLGGGALAGLALLAGRPAWPLLSLAWAALLVAASLVVRALRQQASRRPPAPVLPAAAGALLAWVGSAVDNPPALAAALAVQAVLLAALLPGQATLRACRAGLFDCAWPLPGPALWRLPAAWPHAAGLLAMLPMMATLAAMADWCAGTWGPPALMLALHAVAMLGPALLLRLWPAARRTGDASARLLLAGLLGAGALAGWWRPGPEGWMAASLLQATAWSLAWAGPMLRPATTLPVATASPGLADAALAAALVLALGAATAAFGPMALLAWQSALAAAAALGALASCCRDAAARPA